ncbi:MAG: hypothetical protein Q3971_04080 [Moraxella sp.]|nr:hypothetical protein [Moraxella sp.]
MADVVDNVLEFAPWQSVGIFKFDDDIVKYQTELAQWRFEPKDEYSTEHYHLDDYRIVSVNKQQKIQSIFCYETLIYQGTNLIGLTIDEFKSVTGADYVGDVDVLDFEDDGYPQSVYEFESIGAQVWEKQGKIITIIVSGKDSYSDELCDD